jgi:hypothetical protein
MVHWPTQPLLYAPIQYRSAPTEYRSVAAAMHGTPEARQELYTEAVAGYDQQVLNTCRRQSNDCMPTQRAETLQVCHYFYETNSSISLHL